VTVELRGRSVFKRLETDAEFRKRLGLGASSWLSGTELDDYAWVQYRKQRRIIDDIK
jgi:hypothetical protein